ncbi:thermonuclease family protein [Enterococcus faecalis]|nr:thermonuclease family protein [Enterococcus faecalis]ELY8285509.1 thermonuclease family protein [Enterococcus faecalis]
MRKRLNKIGFFFVSCFSFLLLTDCSTQEIIGGLTQELHQSIQQIEQKQTSSERVAVDFVRHVDGDTSVFLVNGKEQKVRYLLIDTPETVKPNTPVQPFGKEASNRTKTLLSNAKEIQLEFDEANKKRSLWSIIGVVDGKLLQETLVSEGLAKVAYVKNKEAKYLERLEEKQELAKQQHLSIWSN